MPQVLQSDFTTLPFLQNMLADYPLHGHGGMPCLTEDLAWGDDVPLFGYGKIGWLEIGSWSGKSRRS